MKLTIEISYDENDGSTDIDWDVDYPPVNRALNDDQIFADMLKDVAERFAGTADQLWR